MNRLIKILVVLHATLFTSIGLAWLFAPEITSASFGITLGQGSSVSSIVGGLSAFFLTLGFWAFVAARTERRSFFYPVIVLLCCVAFGRIVSWFAHGAPFMTGMIALEIFGAILFYVASRRLGFDDSSTPQQA